MRLALISDVHGNIAALEAVLADARAAGAREYVFLGDYIFDMPFGEKVIRRLRSMRNVHFISGNREGYFERLDEADEARANSQQYGVVYQTWRELSADSKAFIRRLPKTLSLLLPSGRTLYAVHALNLSRADKNRFTSAGRVPAGDAGSAVHPRGISEGLPRVFGGRGAGSDFGAAGRPDRVRAQSPSVIRTVARKMAGESRKRQPATGFQSRRVLYARGRSARGICGDRAARALRPRGGRMRGEAHRVLPPGKMLDGAGLPRGAKRRGRAAAFFRMRAAHVRGDGAPGDPIPDAIMERSAAGIHEKISKMS